VKALVGGRDYNISQFNTATQARRQPGSSMKMFTLVTAINAGMNPEIKLNSNSPLQITDQWEVQNYANTSYGTISLRYATEQSVNTAYAQVALAVGVDNVLATAHSMGIDVDLPPYPSVILGSVGIPPIQMAEAYSVLAADGIHRDAIAITRIEDRNGNTVYEHEDNPVRAVDESIASAALEVMKGVTTWGGTAEVVGSGMTVNQPVAGKTGTTENYRDLWFCGITPQLSVSIWCGYREEAEVYVWGSYGHPYNTACPIFTYFVNSVLDGVPREEFPTSSAQPTYKDNSTWTFRGSQPDEQQYYDYDTNHEDDQTDTTNTD
jgi:membrane peptidoglycan carboxypeptidase